MACRRKYLLIDPNATEERVMDGKMVIGMNKHRELVTLQLTGSVLLHKDQVLNTMHSASFSRFCLFYIFIYFFISVSKMCSLSI